MASWTKDKAVWLGQACKTISMNRRTLICSVINYASIWLNTSGTSMLWNMVTGTALWFWFVELSICEITTFVEYIEIANVWSWLSKFWEVLANTRSPFAFSFVTLPVGKYVVCSKQLSISKLSALSPLSQLASSYLGVFASTQVRKNVGKYLGHMVNEVVKFWNFHKSVEIKSRPLFKSSKCMKYSSLSWQHTQLPVTGLTKNFSMTWNFSQF